MTIFRTNLDDTLLIVSDKYGANGHNELAALVKNYKTIKVPLKNFGHPVGEVWELPLKDLAKFYSDTNIRSLTPMEFTTMLVAKKQAYAEFLSKNPTQTLKIHQKDDMIPESDGIYAREDNKKLHRAGFVRHRVIDDRNEEGLDDGDDS